MPLRLVSIRTPAAAIEVEGSAIPRLQGSPIERALSRILRPTLCAVARAADSKFEIERIDLGHSYADEHLQFHAVLDPSRQSELIDDRAGGDAFAVKFVEILRGTAACVLETLKLQSEGRIVRIAFDRDPTFSWSVTNDGQVQVRGPTAVQQAVRGLVALIKRIAANRDAEVELAVETETFRFPYARAPEEVAIVATECLTGVITSVDDLTSSLTVKHRTKAPGQIFHLSLPSELRDQALDHQLQRRVVEVIAETTRRGKKQISGEISRIQSIDGISGMKAAATGQATSAPRQVTRPVKLRRKR